MSTPMTADATFPARRTHTTRLSFPNVVRSEWEKLWSLRSTRWSVLAAVVSMIGLGIIIAAVQMGRWPHMSLAERHDIKPIDMALGGVNLAQLAIGVLGVLVMSGEYTTGMVRSTMMAVPRRLPVLWAKIAVFGAVTFTLMLLASLVAFFGSEAIFDSHNVGVGLGAPHALRALVGNALFLTVLGAICVGIGGLTRSSAGGISVFVGVMFVIPGISELLPESIGNAIHPYLPSNAGQAVGQAVPDAHMLAPWVGFGVFVAYAVAIIGVTAYLLRRRDV
ncbi:MAG: ABC transporter permease [Actinobacteria bacterium]|nr:ABC transporter permease [Actinomycetota bacterium]